MLVELGLKDPGECVVVVLDGFELFAVRLGEVGVELFQVVAGDAGAPGKRGCHDRELAGKHGESLGQGAQLGTQKLLFLAGLTFGVEQVKVGLAVHSRGLALRLSEFTCRPVAVGFLGELDVVRVLALRHRIEGVNLTTYFHELVLDLLDLVIRAEQPQERRCTAGVALAGCGGKRFVEHGDPGLIHAAESAHKVSPRCPCLLESVGGE